MPVKGRNKSLRVQGQLWCAGDWQPYAVLVAPRNVQAEPRALSTALGVREIPEDGGRQKHPAKSTSLHWLARVKERCEIPPRGEM